MKKLISSLKFKVKYLENIPDDIQRQEVSLQVYSLSFLRNHFVLPLPLLRTDYSFLFYIKEGSLESRIGNETYTANADSIVFVSIDTVSSLKKVSNNLKGYFVLIEDDKMSSLLSQKDLFNVFLIDPILKLNNQTSFWFNSICELISIELKANTSNFKIINNLAQALLNKVLCLSENEGFISREKQLAVNFKQLVYKHYTQHKQISFYADSLAISSNYLNRCVTKVFNKNCKEIIIDVIILNSQILLVETTMSVSEICDYLNIDDSSYFSRLFKKNTGSTPTQYRSKSRVDLS